MSYSLDKGSAKILVLGDSGVGKSSLIHLICHSSILSSAQWTIGCSIDVKLHENFFLEFWDIGGSRSHKIARSFLYHDYHGIMLVFDATNNKSRLNLNEWLMEVSQKANDKDLETIVNINVPTITIATKRDLLPYRTLLDFSESPAIYSSNEDCSVVNFSENVDNSHPYRRHQVSSYPTTSLISSTHNPYAHVDPRTQHSSKPLLENQVIYVNTQDTLSFKSGSKNHEILRYFFRNVIESRNKKVYNKFAI